MPRVLQLRLDGVPGDLDGDLPRVCGALLVSREAAPLGRQAASPQATSPSFPGASGPATRISLTQLPLSQSDGFAQADLPLNSLSIALYWVQADLLLTRALAGTEDPAQYGIEPALVLVRASLEAPWTSQHATRDVAYTQGLLLSLQEDTSPADILLPARRNTERLLTLPKTPLATLPAESSVTSLLGMLVPRGTGVRVTLSEPDAALAAALNRYVTVYAFDPAREPLETQRETLTWPLPQDTPQGLLLPTEEDMLPWQWNVHTSLCLVPVLRGTRLEDVLDNDAAGLQVVRMDVGVRPGYSVMDRGFPVWSLNAEWSMPGITAAAGSALEASSTAQKPAVPVRIAAATPWAWLQAALQNSARSALMRRPEPARDDMEVSLSIEAALGGDIALVAGPLHRDAPPSEDGKQGYMAFHGVAPGATRTLSFRCRAPFPTPITILAVPQGLADAVKNALVGTAIDWEHICAHAKGVIRLQVLALPGRVLVQPAHDAGLSVLYQPNNRHLRIMPSMGGPATVLPLLQASQAGLRAAAYTEDIVQDYVLPEVTALRIAMAPLFHAMRFLIVQTRDTSPGIVTRTTNGDALTIPLAAGIRIRVFPVLQDHTDAARLEVEDLVALKPMWEFFTLEEAGTTPAVVTSQQAPYCKIERDAAALPGGEVGILVTPRQASQATAETVLGQALANSQALRQILPARVAGRNPPQAAESQDRNGATQQQPQQQGAPPQRSSVDPNAQPTWWASSGGRALLLVAVGVVLVLLLVWLLVSLRRSPSRLTAASRASAAAPW
jgi:hypothetical protein